ncbi:MAG: hypothetical protein JRD69_07935 [Deltaproteobacteria bacterium]|nr:hypothetical protein [Deltaproteobacteria bacterium]
MSTFSPKIMLSGREKYMYSKTQKDFGSFGGKNLEETPPSSITTISPGSILRIYSAPMMSKAQDSEAITKTSPAFPIHSGLKP